MLAILRETLNICERKLQDRNRKLKSPERSGIATLATFIAPFGENRLKPNRDFIAISRHLLISRFATKTVKVSVRKLMSLDGVAEPFSFTYLTLYA